MKRIKTNDQVVVISGQDKGKVGRISGFSKDGRRVVVSGVNVRKKSIKARSSNGQMEEGGFKNVELPVHISNVVLYEPEGKSREKVSFIIQEEAGKKTKLRCYRSSKKVVNEQKTSA